MLCIAYVLQRHIKGFSLPSHQMQSEECHRCTGPLGCCVGGKGGQDPYRLHDGRVDRTLRGKTSVGKALLVIPVKKKKKRKKRKAVSRGSRTLVWRKGYFLRNSFIAGSRDCTDSLQ